ncbi:MAG: TonB family protein [Hyphomicrobium sp.]|nr:TonB family protein [Hyphomicrobium sp.]
MQRRARWSGAFAGAAVFHAAVIAAIVLALPATESEDGGPIMLDLPPLSVESTTTEADNAEDARDQTTAPPPSEAEDTPADQPAEAEPLPAPEPVETAAPPEPVEMQEPAPVPLAAAPPEVSVPEAPAAPEPEVVLPKVIEETKPLEKPVEEEPKPQKPETKKKAEQKRPTEADGKKTAPKSNSKAASAAAAGGGKFSPNAISRPHPPYPAGARASRIEGYVVVRYTVSPSGAVTGVSVVSANPAGVFNSVTVSAVRSWRFRPSATGGSGTTTIRFKLR